MAAGGTDWVEVWRGLHGSRDFAAVVSAGGQLCAALEQARAAWRERTEEIARTERDHDLTVECLQEQLVERDDAELDLGAVVRAWHELDHVEAWPVCPHMVCRRVVLTNPDVRATGRADVLIVQTGNS